MKKSKLLMMLLGFVYMSQSTAAVSLDRTRVIYPANKESVVLNIENTNKTTPYLAQAWLEDDAGQKVEEGALVALPPIQHLAAGAKGIIQVNKTSLADKLPQDRESLYYFNLREIPPASDKENVLQIALQTNIKLFYRPVSIVKEAETDYVKKLVLTENSNGYVINNPTPFYITIIGMGKTEQESNNSAFDVVMIKPFSELTVNTPKSANTYVTYVNDFGGRTSVLFNCKNKSCVAAK